ncbi:MAG: DNA polymerase III subunit alpha, partial [Chlamydiia bacterium]
DLKRVNKKNFELLADAGAFDFTGWSRDALKAFLELQYEASLRQQKDRQAGFMDLFQSQQQGPAAALVAPTVAQPRAPIQLWLREKELLGFFLTGHPMDHYREILQRLSCVALNDVEGLPHQTLFRCAFIIESLETRISAKSGKKFAILQISDGFESYELPIWPELYEQNHDLLSPNRLLYAILQIDHASGESLRLQAKWVADLTQADESMVQACDRAYDKAKNGLRQAEYRNQARAAAPPPVAAPPAAPALLLQVDVRQARLSHVLALKQILHRHRGPSSLEVHFQLDQRCVGQLRIPAKWGVQPSPILIEALLQLPGVFLPQ